MFAVFLFVYMRQKYEESNNNSSPLISTERLSQRDGEVMASPSSSNDELHDRLGRQARMEESGINQAGPSSYHPLERLARNLAVMEESFYEGMEGEGQPPQNGIMHQQLVAGGVQLRSKRKLYFNPAYFERELLESPPPRAQEFLCELRHMVALAKTRIKLRQFSPTLQGIPEMRNSQESVYADELEPEAKADLVSGDSDLDEVKSLSSISSSDIDNTTVQPADSSNSSPDSINRKFKQNINKRRKFKKTKDWESNNKNLMSPSQQLYRIPNKKIFQKKQENDRNNSQDLSVRSKHGWNHHEHNQSKSKNGLDGLSAAFTKFKKSPKIEKNKKNLEENSTIFTKLENALHKKSLAQEGSLENGVQLKETPSKLPDDFYEKFSEQKIYETSFAMRNQQQPHDVVLRTKLAQLNSFSPHAKDVPKLNGEQSPVAKPRHIPRRDSSNDKITVKVDIENNNVDHQSAVQHL